MYDALRRCKLEVAGLKSEMSGVRQPAVGSEIVRQLSVAVMGTLNR